MGEQHGEAGSALGPEGDSEAPEREHDHPEQQPGEAHPGEAQQLSSEAPAGGQAQQPSSDALVRAADADRERVARRVQVAFGEGRLTVNEFEQRLDAAYAARTFAELEPLTADLPATTPEPLRPGPPEPTGARPAPERRGSAISIAVLGGASRTGPWVVPPRHTSYAFWGGIDIDLREARLTAAHTTITAVAIMGGIDIVVPDDIAFDVTGIGFMGAFESTGTGPDQPNPDAPVVRVNGFAFMGAVEVKRKPRKPPKKVSGGASDGTG